MTKKFDITKWDETKTQQENADIQNMSTSAVRKWIRSMGLKFRKIYNTGNGYTCLRKFGTLEKYKHVYGHREVIVVGDNADMY